LKTKRDYSISSIIIILGLILLLPAAFSDSFSQHIIGQMWIIMIILFIFLGLLKIEQIEISEGNLTKANFIFKRTINLNSIKKYKVKAIDMNTYPQYNIASILKIFKNGQRYSNFRLLTIYPEGKWRLKIDERTMPSSDFKKVLNEIKKKVKKKHLTMAKMHAQPT
jgi:hypothetical protein